MVYFPPFLASRFAQLSLELIIGDEYERLVALVVLALPLSPAVAVNRRYDFLRAAGVAREYHSRPLPGRGAFRAAAPREVRLRLARSDGSRLDLVGKFDFRLHAMVFGELP